MAEAKLCPLKAGAVVASILHLSSSEEWTWEDKAKGRMDIARIKEYAQEEFGQCDREKCALWIEYPVGERGSKNRCGLIHE